MLQAHTFHIPVMGISYTMDTPLKVSQFGIDSVISVSDDILMEKMRKFYCEKFQIPYQKIEEKSEDHRAKRITSYLNLINDLAREKYDNFIASAVKNKAALDKYFRMLPDHSELKEIINDWPDASPAALTKWLKSKLYMGSIDVNILTKADRENYKDGKKLDAKYNNVHSALRGYALSKLKSSIVFSAGLNPRLYAYLEEFKDFYPDQNGEIRKKIILKVSDFRSALIQGKFLAKKGLWVSEFRIESGLNCGGHAFATQGNLMGPILEEFREKKNELKETLNELFVKGLTGKEKPIPKETPPIKVTAQGGVGTAAEHDFLLKHYQLESVGWGTPFLLVPEATVVDDITLQQLKKAKEKDLYLSNISPLGIRFNNLRDNTKDLEKQSYIDKKRPGSPCPKKYLATNKEFSEKGLCTASRQYQYLKLKELEKETLSKEEYQMRYEKIIEKSCICVGLGTSALLVNHIEHKTEGEGVSICPGPNLAYFSSVMSLEEMVGQIYGRNNVIDRKDRPNLFLKELNMYLDYLKEKVDELKIKENEREEKYLQGFAGNLKSGIAYYRELFDKPPFKGQPGIQEKLDEALSIIETQEVCLGKELT